MLPQEVCGWIFCAAACSCLCFCFRPPRCHHLHYFRRLVCGFGECWAGLWQWRIPQTSKHHLDMVPSSTCLLLIQIYGLSVWLARLWQLYIHSAHCNTICAAKLLFTLHWNVSENIHKPQLTRIHTDCTIADNKEVCLNLKKGVPFFSWLNSSWNKSYGVMLRNLGRKRGREIFSHEGGSVRHKEEQETHAKHLIIVPCFKYHSNAW